MLKLCYVHHILKERVFVYWYNNKNHHSGNYDFVSYLNTITVHLKCTSTTIAEKSCICVKLMVMSFAVFSLFMLNSDRL